MRYFISSDVLLFDSLAGGLKWKFSEALAAHRAGRFQEAEKTYTEILRSNPRHFASMHMLGVVYLQTGRARARS